MNYYKICNSVFIIKLSSYLLKHIELPVLLMSQKRYRPILDVTKCLFLVYFAFCVMVKNNNCNNKKE